MNEIVSVKDENKLDGYKLVYPNNKDLTVRLDYLLVVMKVVI